MVKPFFSIQLNDVEFIFSLIQQRKEVGPNCLMIKLGALVNQQSLFVNFYFKLPLAFYISVFWLARADACTETTRTF